MSGTMPSAAVGRQAPDFTLPDAIGAQVALREFRGRWVVLYFYPKDDTPGCTREACAFRDAEPQLKRHDAVVLGVSFDNAASHQRFIAKFGLPFRLLSDTPERTVATAYGVFKQKSMYGRTFLGIERTTVLISPDGTVAALWRKVKVDGHAAAVLAALVQAAGTTGTAAAPVGTRRSAASARGRSRDRGGS